MLRDKRIFQVLFLTYSTLLLLGLSDNIRGPLYPEILKAFDVTNTRGSFFFGLSSLAGFIGGMSGHHLEKRYGALTTLRIAVLFMFLSQLLFAFAPSFGLLLASTVVFGGSLGVMGVMQNLMIVQALPAGALKNKVLAGLHGTYAGASLLAPLIVNLVVFVEMPFPIWRTCFAITALFGIVILALTFRGPDLQIKDDEKPQREPTKLETAAHIYFGVMLASYVLCEILVSSRMALYTRSEFGADLTVSSWYTAGFFVSLLIGRILFTFWTPAVSLKSQLLGSLVLSVLSLMIGIYFHPLGLVVSGFCMGPFYPLMMVAAGHLFPSTVSRALSWAIALSSLFVVMMHLSVGYVTDLWSLQAAFYFGPAFCVLALLLMVGYEKVFRRLQHSF